MFGTWTGLMISGDLLMDVDVLFETVIGSKLMVWGGRGFSMHLWPMEKGACETNIGSVFITERRVEETRKGYKYEFEGSGQPAGPLREEIKRNP